jgi:hypothetical protein
MRNRHVILAGTALLLAAGLAQAAGAAPRRHRGAAAELLRSPSFNVSGEFSGSLAGTILLEGTLYRLDPNASVYEIGSGPVAQGAELIGRRVFLSGIRLNGNEVITSVIVRPADEGSREGDELDRCVQLKDAGAVE